jgi:hypothetical protein
MMAPRGKFQMTLFDGGMQCVNGKGNTFVITSAHQIVVFPSPQDCRLKKKVGANMVLLCLDNNNNNDKVAFHKKSWTHAVCTVLLQSQGWCLVSNEIRTFVFQKHRFGGVLCISHIIVTHSLSLSYILYAEHQCFGIGLPYIPLCVHVDRVDRDT